MGAAAELAVDAAGDGEHLPSLVGSVVGSDEGAAALGGLGDDDPKGEAADEAVSRAKAAGAGGGAERDLGDDGAASDRLLAQLQSVARIWHVDAAGEDADGTATGGERAAMGGRVCADGEAADDGDAAGCEVPAEGLRDQTPVGSNAPRAHDGNGRFVAGVEGAADEEDRGRVIDLAQVGRILGAADGD